MLKGKEKMNATEIGLRIANLRKMRGIKQEELANYVGVTAQAVSKWENGGTPDVELLPKIADYFNVTIDYFFNRTVMDHALLEELIDNRIREASPQLRMKEAFDLCWIIERALFKNKLPSLELQFFDEEFPKGKSLWDEAEAYQGNHQIYSSVQLDEGYTQMGLYDKSHYFLLVPDAKDKEAAYFEGINYPNLFSLLADDTVFRALKYLYCRESKSAFTPKLLSKELSITADKTNEILQVLKKFGMVNKSVAEIDDELTELYTFYGTPSFPAMLIFAKELICRPSHFNFHCQSRKKPYLK